MKVERSVDPDETVKIKPDDAFLAMAIINKYQRESGRLVDITMGDVARLVRVRDDVRAGRRHP